MSSHRPRAGANVQQRITEDTRLREAAQNVHLQRRLDAWAVWQGNNKAYLAKAKTNRQKKIDEELDFANEELKLARRSLLKSLLEKDHARYEKELNQMGLALVRSDLH